MCRLLGASLAAATPFQRRWLDEFSKLADSGIVSMGSSPGHRDGWGVAGISSGAPRMFARHPGSILAVPHDVDSAWQGIANARPDTVIAHLRKASPGLAVSLVNTHPFRIGNALFCHNGSIRHPDRLPVHDPSALAGSTDSELLFAYLMEHAGNAPPDRFAARLADSIRASRELTEASSWTFLLAHGSRLFAYREACERGYVPDDEPGDECLRTHTLFLATGRDATLCCSEPIALPASGLAPWSPMENRELVVLEAGAIVAREMV